MIKYKYDSSGDRSEFLNKIKEGNLKVVDIGGATSFADGYLDAIVDINPPLAQAKHFFQGNINLPEVWEKVMKHVKENGKWDYALFIHTIEDIANPLMACYYIEKIAKAGLIITPSKFWELGRFGINAPRGFIHHRNLIDVIDGEMLGFPKLNILEHPRFDKITSHPQAAERKELIVEWEDEIGFKMVNDDWLGPNEEAVNEMYDLLMKDLN